MVTFSLPAPNVRRSLFVRRADGMNEINRPPVRCPADDRRGRMAPLYFLRASTMLDSVQLVGQVVRKRMFPKTFPNRLSNGAKASEW
jgi:hypothetical protein